MSTALFAAYITAVGATAALDMFWIGFFAKGIYEKGIGHLLAPSFNIFGAVLFYLLYALGIMFFVVMPSEGKSLLRVIALGALFGFICYGVYDLTNLATLRNWPWSVTVMDMLWGAVLTALASAAALAILRIFIR